MPPHTASVPDQAHIMPVPDAGTPARTKAAGIARERWLVAAFFVAFLLAGLGIYKDFGIAWDEPEQQRYGRTVVDYMLTSDRTLLTEWDKYHGPAFEILLDEVDRLTGPKTTQERFWQRHLLNFLLFYFSVWCFYLFCRGRFNDWRIALLGCVMLVTSPRIFGQAFYNSKDLPFLALMTVSFFTLQRFAEEKTLKWSILHGISSGLAVAIRILGLLVPAFTVFYLIRDRLGLDKERWPSILVRASTYGTLFFGTMVLFWPILWDRPLYHLWHALKEMSRFPWSGTVVYLGKVVSAADLPWHYIPVWVLVTIPPVYLLLSLIGIVSAGSDLVRNFRSFLRTRMLDLAVLGWVLIPCLAVVILHSVVYDGWRHLYFIYPGLVFLALLGWTGIWGLVKTKLRGRSRTLAHGILASAIAAQTLTVTLFMVRAHPYEALYFNSLIGGVAGARFKMEMDYFGLSYRRALEDLARYDKSAGITVFVEQAPAVFDAAFLKPTDYSRFVFVRDLASAMYFLGAYRSRTTEYGYGTPIHTEEVDGVPILSVYKLRDQAPASPRLSIYKLREAVAQSPEFQQETLRGLWRKNLAGTGGMSPGELRLKVEQGIRKALGAYISAPTDPQISLQIGNSGNLREGRIGMLRIAVPQGAAGDFRRRPLGVPFRNLHAELLDLTLDMAALFNNRLDIRYVGKVVLHSLELSPDAINGVLSGQPGTLRQLRVGFSGKDLSLRWLGTPEVRVDAEIETVTDRNHVESDNLSLQLHSIRIGLVTIPGSWLQWALEPRLPLIKASPRVGALRLGRAKVTGGQFHIGIDR
jgi:4-amino-4-deoxy-L-arabinose transferase-like glycosyltransferase